MARIHPFRPYRYTAAAGPIENLVTQPYDKISPAMQSRYLGLSPHNLVRLILGERFPSDTDADNVYTRAAAYLNDWIGKGILARETEPCLFAYFQEFTVPDSGERLTRKAFIGLGPVEDYSAHIVHRHEQTLTGPKEDRRKLLQHTHAHFGQLFMLYPDPDRALDRLLDETAQAPPLCALTDEYEATHRLWRIADPARISAIEQLMDPRKLLIADGHHRYETALAFRNANPSLPGADRVMMTFVNMYSPGLTILGTHRLVKGLPDFDYRQFLNDARADFRIEHFGSVEALKAGWARDHAHKVRIAAVFEGASEACVFEAERQQGDLDVKVLHQLLLQEHLGISEEAVRDEKHITYVRGFDAAVERVRSGAAQIAFLLEPPTVEQVAEISFAGGVMPQKSTDFYPKLLSGLTIYKLES